MPFNLLPGHQAPDFHLVDPVSHAEIELSQNTDSYGVLLFWDEASPHELFETIEKYLERIDEFKNLEASLIGISNARTELIPISNIDDRSRIFFAEISSAQETAYRFGVLSAEEIIQPVVFLLGPGKLIRKVYPADQYPTLPNPAMTLRALRNLAQTPVPPPISGLDWYRGSEHAEVSVIEYADYQCGPCRETYRTLKQVLPQFGEKILWAHRHLPLRHSHPLAQQAAEAAEAAGVQDCFWEMHDLLFESNGALEMDDLMRYADMLGLDNDQFKAGLIDRVYQKAVNDDLKAAVKAGIKLPPMVFINQILFDGPRTVEAVTARINSLLFLE